MAIKGKRREAGKTHSLISLIIKTALCSVSIALIIFLLRPVLSEYFIPQGVSEIKEKDLRLASTITGEDARYYYLSGLMREHLPESREKAKQAYLESLKRNPTDSMTWLAFARTYRENNEEKLAEYAVKKAVYMDRNNPEIIWSSGMFFLLGNKTDEAARLFSRYIHMVPDEQENVYSLFYILKLDPVYILDYLIPNKYDFHTRYLGFLMSNRMVDESYEVWKTIDVLKPDAGGKIKSDYIRYCNFLIDSGRIEKALQIWDGFIKKFKTGEAIKPYGGDVWNGNFELDIEDGGFDWRLGRSDGVSIFIDRDIKRTGYASLSAHFDGKSNPDIYIARQAVPVESGGKYTVSAAIRTKDLSTKNGVFLEVSGLGCDLPANRTNPLTGTNHWEKMTIDFTVPGACKAVWVGIRRERSDKFDNKISGDVWIDSIMMTEKKGS